VVPGSDLDPQQVLHGNLCIQVQNASTSNSARMVQAPCPDSSPDNRSAKFVE
jgi:hypothetical protein